MKEQELLIGMGLSPLLKTLLNLNFPYSEVLREEIPRGVMKIKVLLGREAFFSIYFQCNIQAVGYSLVLMAFKSD